MLILLTCFLLAGAFVVSKLLQRHYGRCISHGPPVKECARLSYAHQRQYHVQKVLLAIFILIVLYWLIVNKHSLTQKEHHGSNIQPGTQHIQYPVNH